MREEKGDEFTIWRNNILFPIIQATVSLIHSSGKKRSKTKPFSSVKRKYPFWPVQVVAQRKSGEAYYIIGILMKVSVPSGIHLYCHTNHVWPMIWFIFIMRVIAYVAATTVISNLYYVFQWLTMLSSKVTFTFQNVEEFKRVDLKSAQGHETTNYISCLLQKCPMLPPPSHPPTMLQPHSLLTCSCKNSVAATSHKHSRGM